MASATPSGLGIKAWRKPYALVDGYSVVIEWPSMGCQCVGDSKLSLGLRVGCSLHKRIERGD
ncbi:Uncharacterised protein [Vibrio cholerae]|nr:Uncharacterised protein [Vibrio cholerae]CSB09911.1 Uncharacterised protein [Vibrio cholerae]CSD09546.1 Uncharacterised protein [Vibrio cholerae]CSD17171.1 Uncharacterised protein [Vibrio cholerae]